MARLIRAEEALGARSSCRAPAADRAREPEGQCHRDSGTGNGRMGRRARRTRCRRAKRTLGPLHGLPVAHKDLLETRGIRTTFGSPLYKDYIPTEDDIVVERMRRAGAITHRQDKHAGIRRRIANVQHVFRRDAQSLRFDENLRRIVAAAPPSRWPADSFPSRRAPIPAVRCAIRPHSAMSSASGRRSAGCPIRRRRSHGRR